VARYVELRRHTDSDGDPLTEEGVRAALEIGRRLMGPYALLVSSGAQRATQTLACFACALADTAGGGSSSKPLCARISRIAGARRTAEP
jgi:broad specificity phosphatase PhoE